MYKITFPIPVVTHGEFEISMPTGLARDILSQLKFEPKVRIICPVASEIPQSGYSRIDVRDHPGLSWRLLPWSGGKRGFWLNYLPIRKILIDEARTATVWHAPCSISLWDITTLNYIVGRQFAPALRVLGLDSDPAAMIERSGTTLVAGWIAQRIVNRYRRWAAESDATIMVGEGVLRRYGPYAKMPVPTNAVWLNTGDLATPAQIEEKFTQGRPVRMVLASRLLPWKGVDDVLKALDVIASEWADWHLDIVGDGPERARLGKLAESLGSRVSFRQSVPYGPEFFAYLRTFQIALIPTRATEEARIAYDAAASGCVLISSRTSTLESALESIPIRFEFEPGNIDSLVLAMRTAISSAASWKHAAERGIQAMRGRTIDEMHRIRYSALSRLRSSNL